MSVSMLTRDLSVAILFIVFALSLCQPALQAGLEHQLWKIAAQVELAVVTIIGVMT